MENYEEMASTRLDQPPVLPGRRHRWLLIGGLAFAFMLVLGVGTVIGSSLSTTHAAALAQTSTSSSQTLAVAQGSSNDAQALNFATGDSNSVQGLAAPPAQAGQCDALTVSSVSGNTIVAKARDGSSVTIHTTASTKYTQDTKTATASTITVGTRIHVTGTHNSDGSITATSIDIG